MLKNNLLFLKAYKNIIKKMAKGYGISKIYPIKLIMKKIESNMKSDFAEIQGSKMFLDTNDSLDLSILGVYGELDTKIVKEQLHENNIVIDVGANIGYYTLLSAKLVGNSGKVFAFEPEPRNFEILQKNIKINNYRNTIAENYAVSDSNGEISLFLAKNGIVGHRIYDSDECDNSIKVKKITLDNYFQKLNLLDKINLIKIDVEGFEFGVLKGMEKIIEKSKHLKLFVEFNRLSLKEAGFNPKEMLDFLYDRDFKIYFLDYKNNRVKEAEKNELLTSKENLNENINILCSKKEISY